SPLGYILAATGSGAASTVTNLVLAAPGDYLIAVRPELPGGGLGAYSIGVTTGTPTTLSNHGTDPAIDFGQAVDGSIVKGGDFRHSLAVSAAQVGKPATIVVSGRTGDYYFGAVLELYSPDGTLLTSSSTYYRDPGVGIRDFILPVAGTYTIRVRDDN